MELKKKFVLGFVTLALAVSCGNKSDNLIDFEFWNDMNGKLKQISTNSKKMRGFTLNYIVKNRITNINNLKDIALNEYVFNKDMSSKKKFVYVKK